MQGMLLARLRLSQVLAEDADAAWYGSLSAPPFEHVDAIDIDDALLGKEDAAAEADGAHYTRQIGNLGRVRKLMVGNPLAGEP